VHAEAFSLSALASVRAVASRSPDRAAEFAARWGIPAWHTDYRELARRPDVDLVSVAAPNWLHRDIVVAAAEAGKHVVCEKPLARTLREADEMIAACRSAGVKLMYAEEICFAPKYVRAKELADEGALGEVYLVRQSEQHYGPHSDWFWDPELAGGGVLMDMACHGIEFARWIYGKPAANSASAEVGTFVHHQRTRAEDHAIVTLRVRRPPGSSHRGKLGQAGRHGGSGRDPRLPGSYVRRLAPRLLTHHVQRCGLRICRGKGP